MPRLSPADLAFFLLETPERPMNVGALLVLEPPPGAASGFADRLVAGMLRRPVGPPFSYRLVPGPFPPLATLDDTQAVDPRKQLHRHRLPRGSGLQQLLDRICTIHVKLLPRDEPLWQMHVFTGLEDGRVALYFKTHHGLIDGIGFIRIVTSLVGTTPRTGRPRALWEGMLAVQGAAQGPKPAHATTPAASLAPLAAEASRAANDLVSLFWHQGRRGLGLGPGLAAPFVGTPDVLRTPPSANRSMAHVTVPLATARRIAKGAGAKINDVMLAGLDVAMHRYLAGRGTPPDAPLVADVPVALEDHGGAGNRITILQVPLGQPEASPLERLAQIVGETGTMKEQVRSHAGSALMLYSIVQHSLAGAIEALGLANLPMLANLVVSNPAGLDRRVWFNGAAVDLALPISVVAHHQVLNVTITTYVDELHVTFMALKEAVPGLRDLARHTREAIEALDAAVAGAPAAVTRGARKTRSTAARSTKTVKPARGTTTGRPRAKARRKS